MSKKIKKKRIQGTIYYDEDNLQYIHTCMETSGRKSISDEINYSIKKLREIREKNNNLAADIAEEYFAKVSQDNQRQS